MIKRFLFSILYLSIISIIIGILHYVFIKKLNLFIPLIHIYLFNYLMTAIGLAILFLINKVANDKVGYTFLGLGIIKMAVSVAFLMPLINSNYNDKVPDTLNFFFCYFLFLIIESVIAVKLLDKNK